MIISSISIINSFSLNAKKVAKLYAKINKILKQNLLPLDSVLLYDLSPHPTTTAPNLQVAMHWPHLMHFDWSIACGCFTMPEIA